MDHLNLDVQHNMPNTLDVLLGRYPFASCPLMSLLLLLEPFNFVLVVPFLLLVPMHIWIGSATSMQNMVHIT